VSSEVDVIRFKRRDLGSLRFRHVWAIIKRSRLPDERKHRSLEARRGLATDADLDVLAQRRGGRGLSLICALAPD